jgi:hypothetical protein
MAMNKADVLERKEKDMNIRLIIKCTAGLYVWYIHTSVIHYDHMSVYHEKYKRTQRVNYVLTKEENIWIH